MQASMTVHQLSLKLSWTHKKNEALKACAATLLSQEGLSRSIDSVASDNSQYDWIDASIQSYQQNSFLRVYKMDYSLSELNNNDKVVDVNIVTSQPVIAAGVHMQRDIFIEFDTRWRSTRRLTKREVLKFTLWVGNTNVTEDRRN